MVETLVLKADKRKTSGTRVSRKARAAGLIPAIVYGHGAEPLAITLNYHDLALELQHHHRLLQVDVEGKKEQFLVKEIQYDHLGDKVIHLDLARVDLDERVTMTVALPSIKFLDPFAKQWCANAVPSAQFLQFDE